MALMLKAISATYALVSALGCRSKKRVRTMGNAA